MNTQRIYLVVGLCSLAVPSGAQPRVGVPDSLRMHTWRITPVEPAVGPSDDLIAALPYDGSSSYVSRAQDVESNVDAYDTFVIEDFEITKDAVVHEFRSRGVGNGNPFATTDVRVWIYEDTTTGLPGQDGFDGALVIESLPGVGFFDGMDYVSDFGGQCLSAGSYFLVWAARLDFSCCGSALFFQQGGNTSVGGGDPDNAWLWNPGLGLGLGPHFRVIDPPSGRQTGVNYLLFGEPSNCLNPCANPECSADLDFDGDADADDFFLFLDLFSAGNPCADLDASGTIDSGDFFAYLDLFAQGCP